MKELMKIRFEIELDLELNDKEKEMIYNEATFKYLPKILFESEYIEYISSVFLISQGILGSVATSALFIITNKRVVLVVKKPTLPVSVNDIPFSRISNITGSGRNIVIHNINGKNNIAVTVRGRGDTNKIREKLYDLMN